MTNARITETFTLPSQGKIYEEDVNPEVTLASMTTKHEMLRLSVNEDSQKLMAEIIDDCIQNDIGISSYDMCLPDFQFLLYKLREVTFGNEYEMSCICPFCGTRQDIVVDLDDLEIKEFSDEIFDYMEVDLPQDESTVEITMQTPRMLDMINKEVKQAKKKLKNKENPQILYLMLDSIVKKDDESFNSIEGETWLRNLPLGDANRILSAIDKLNSSFGMDLSVYHTCNFCGEEIIAPFRVNDTFFRPAIY